jgi:hypothetical protein
MTTYLIHYTRPSGTPGYIVVQGNPEMEDELLNEALAKVSKRKGVDPWIEDITALCEPPRSWARH